MMDESIVMTEVTMLAAEEDKTPNPDMSILEIKL
jgi:hypothetical protein